MRRNAWLLVLLVNWSLIEWVSFALTLTFHWAWSKNTSTGTSNGHSMIRVTHCPQLCHCVTHNRPQSRNFQRFQMQFACGKLLRFTERLQRRINASRVCLDTHTLFPLPWPCRLRVRLTSPEQLSFQHRNYFLNQVFSINYARLPNCSPSEWVLI